jgi:hypothetical protein
MRVLAGQPAGASSDSNPSEIISKCPEPRQVGAMRYDPVCHMFIPFVRSVSRKHLGWPL